MRERDGERKREGVRGREERERKRAREKESEGEKGKELVTSSDGNRHIYINIPNGVDSIIETTLI